MHDKFSYRAEGKLYRIASKYQQLRLSNMNTNKIFRYLPLTFDKYPNGVTYFHSTRSLLENKQLYFSDINTFNDPFEGRLATGPLRKKLDVNLQAQNSRHYVCCFSKTNSSNAMWAHYASNRTGVCVEYDLNELKRNFECLDIVYVDRLAEIPQSEAHDHFSLLRYKTKCWAYEMEIRLVSSKPDLSVFDSATPKAMYALSLLGGLSTNLLSWSTALNIPLHVWDSRFPEDDLKLNFTQFSPNS
jgi:hypothetical protein